MDELTFDNLYAAGWTQADSGADVGSEDWLAGLNANAGGVTEPQESSDNGDALDGLLAANNNFADVPVTTNGFTPAQTQSIQDAETGADAVLKGIAEQRGYTPPPASKESSLMDILNSKMGAGVATQLVGGLLGGLGSGAAAKANNKAQNDLLDKKYNQQLDYIRQMRKAGTIQRQNWAPALSSGILGSK